MGGAVSHFGLLVPIYRMKEMFAAIASNKVKCCLTMKFNKNEVACRIILQKILMIDNLERCCKHKELNMRYLIYMSNTVSIPYCITNFEIKTNF